MNSDTNVKTGRTLIINYYHLAEIGGIEVYVHNLVDFMINNGVRVVWLQEEGSLIHDSFKKVLLDDRVEKIIVSSNLLLWFKHGNFTIASEDETVILSFRMMDKLKAEAILRKYKNYNIKSIYAIPDTVGTSYYVESVFSGCLRKFVFKVCSTLYSQWQKNGHLVFFAPKQIDVLEQKYNITVRDGYSKLLPSLRPFPPLDFAELKRRSKRKSFNIITLGRLDFPHKEYILGLVKAFYRLKKKYSQLTLTIIGDGHSRDVLEREISLYEEFVRKDIHLLGTIARDDLQPFFRDSHLNISVAAGVAIGASYGVVSIPAKNYCTGECEVYGFLPDSKLMTVSTCAGELVDSYIEKVVNMSDAEYYELAIASYDTFNRGRDVNPWFLFEKTKDYVPYIVPKSKLILMIMIDYCKKIKWFFVKQNFNRTKIVKRFIGIRSKGGIREPFGITKRRNKC